jgi:phage gpG-like protein
MSTTASVEMQAVVAVLRRLERRVQNTSAVTAVLALDLVDAVENEFVTEGRGRWPELSPETIRQRRASTTPKMLVDTGILAASIQPSSGADFAEAGTNNPYAIFHVSDRPRTKIPKRDFTAIDFDKILEAMADDYLEHVVRF